MISYEVCIWGRISHQIWRKLNKWLINYEILNVYVFIRIIIIKKAKISFCWAEKSRKERERIHFVCLVCMWSMHNTDIPVRKRWFVSLYSDGSINLHLGRFAWGEGNKNIKSSSSGIHLFQNEWVPRMMVWSLRYSFWRANRELSSQDLRAFLFSITIQLLPYTGQGSCHHSYGVEMYTLSQLAVKDRQKEDL